MIFLKILLLIIIILLLIFIIICLSSIVIKINFWNGKLQWYVAYFGFQILPFKKKTNFLDKFQKKKKKPKAKEKKKFFLLDKILIQLQKFVTMTDMLSSGFYALSGTLQKFAKAIKWCNIKTDIKIGNEDAYECAKQYGLVQAGLQNLLALLDTLTQVKRKKIVITCDFTRDDSRY
ncbi:MAG: hypothetical protein K2H93_02985, partial [Oscillospiraceae bacterium]|nr:hypothetical protein [Oscillospiraceae bacterium]